MCPRVIDTDEVQAALTALRDGDDDAVARACALLSRERPPGAVLALRQAAHALSSSTARRACVVALVRLSGEVLLREVAHALVSDDAQVVIGAARILGDVGDARAVPNLLEALHTDDERKGAVIMQALAKIGDAVCVPWLVAAVEHGFATAAGCHALGTLGDARALPVLTRLKDHVDKATALAASAALVQLQETQVREAQAPEDTDRAW